jgi:hypothetical protein
MARTALLAVLATLALAAKAVAADVRGTSGPDTLTGTAEADRIHALGDGRTGDTITCGEGEDTVRAGRNDTVAEDCETVRRPGEGARGPRKGDDEDDESPFDDDGRPGKGPKRPE